MKRERFLDVLIGLDLFRSFPREELIGILDASEFEIKEYQKGQIIHLQNEVCQSMDIIVAGKVAVQKIDEDGNVLTINIFSAPEIIGAHLIFSTHNVYPMTVVAESNVIVSRLQRELIIELGRHNSDFMLDLLQIISDRILTLADTIKTISHNTIRKQIIAYLTYEYRLQKSFVLKLNYTKKELAERFGVQRTSLSRELNKMRKDRLLDYSNKTITIKRLSLLIDNH